jgi:hypothetical protein
MLGGSVPRAVAVARAAAVARAVAVAVARGVPVARPGMGHFATLDVRRTANARQGAYSAGFSHLGDRDSSSVQL